MQIRIALFAALGVALAAGTALAGGDWNDTGIAWRPYDEGLTEAKAQDKPVCLIFYTDWCPHCQRYSGVFHDSAVVERSKQFVMIRLNKDEHPKLSAQYDVDGEYIPRTLFLAPDGTLGAQRAPRDEYVLFYDPTKPDELLAAMGAVLEKRKPSDESA